MKRRRDDPQYVRSAVATLAFYAAVLALCWAAGLYLRWGALAGLGALLLWLYRGPLFGAERWPEKMDVAAMFENENENENEGARSSRESESGSKASGVPPSRRRGGT